jgi:DNA-binding MarR family transcriptional regulator
LYHLTGTWSVSTFQALILAFAQKQYPSRPWYGYRSFCSTSSSNSSRESLLDRAHYDVYTSIMTIGAPTKQSVAALFDLPCACQNLRRVTRVVTRIYDVELRKAGLEITQLGLLTALAAIGEANQKRLSAGFAMDSTTLTRTLKLLRNQGWVRVRPGKDRRERLFSLTSAGMQRLVEAQPYWDGAERRLRQRLGHAGSKRMKRMVSRLTTAAVAAQQISWRPKTRFPRFL